MAIEFTLKERPLGWAAHAATPSEWVEVVNARLVHPDEGGLVAETLEHLQRMVMDQIAGFPAPNVVAHFLIVIRHDLSGVAYVDELTATIGVRAARAVVAGAALVDGDIASVEEVKFNVDVPDDAAVIVMQSHGWRRAVYFDLGPIAPEPKPRIGLLSKLMAVQTANLWGIDRRSEVPPRTRVDGMAAAYQVLRALLDERCEEERRYQELLEDHPWMLGLGMYTRFQRHGYFDERNIPDFTGRRTADDSDDIIELKQPFLAQFREDGDFRAEFHAAWNQAERYLAFARDNRDYLRREKGMRFDTPKCLLLVGSSWTEEQAKAIRIKELANPSIRIMTYEQLLVQASQVLSVMRTALLNE